MCSLCLKPSSAPSSDHRTAVDWILDFYFLNPGFQIIVAQKTNKQTTKPYMSVLQLHCKWYITWKTSGQHWSYQELFPPIEGSRDGLSKRVGNTVLTITLEKGLSHHDSLHTFTLPGRCFVCMVCRKLGKYKTSTCIIQVSSLFIK